MDDVRYERRDGHNRMVMTKTTGAATGDGEDKDTDEG